MPREKPVTHPALQPGATAVVTGAAAGIGLAAARRLAADGLNVVIADLGQDRLDRAAAAIAERSPRGADAVLAVETDVSRPEDLAALEALVTRRFGGTDVLMNNAGIQPGSAIFGPIEAWERVVAVNLWGVIHGTRAFVPGMIARGRPGMVINTGSKQGITTPPGDPAYNLAKAGVRVFTEALAHELRGTAPQIAAHLLIPGFVFTELAAPGRTVKPDGAWTADQTVDFMFDRLAESDFYIMCPDNDVPRSLDERRILWAAQDIIENRPALSRWHPDWTARFADFAENR
jgi:NAD(P)-dependent dehydrogenase (short-subunit alcohol dehydrogenase family)